MSGKKERRIKRKAPVVWYRNRWYQLLVILVAVFAVYGRSISNDYNIDDAYIVPLDDANPLPAEGISAIFKLLSTNYNEVEGLEYGFRPMGKITMALEYELWENNPQMSHVVNLLLYALNIFVLLLFLEQIALLCDFRNIHVLFIGLLIFLVHPLHTEVVCSIKNREEILSFMLMLLAVLQYIRFSDDRKWYRIPIFMITMFFAFLSKETAFNIFGILALVIIYQAMKKSGGFMTSGFLKALFTRNRLIFIGIATILFLFVLVFAPSQMSDGKGGELVNTFETNPYYFTDGIKIIPIGIQTIAFYLGKLLYPHPLLFYYGYDMLPVIGWESPMAWAGLAALLLIAAAALWLLKKQKGLFGVFWVLFFFATLLPFANAGLRFVSGIVGERLAYQASLGFCMLVAMGLFGVVKRIRNDGGGALAVYYIAAGLLVVPMVYGTVKRSLDWKDKITLYEADIPYLSRSARANQMIANTYMKEADALRKKDAEKARETVSKAKEALYRSVDVYPDFSQAWFDLGRIYLSYTPDLDSTLYCLQRVKPLHPLHYFPAQLLLAEMHMNEFADSLAALNHYKEAYLVRPEDRSLYNKTASLAFQLEQIQLMEIIGPPAVACGYAEALSDMGDLYAAIGKPRTAGVYYRAAWSAGIRNERIRTFLDGLN